MGRVSLLLALLLSGLAPANPPERFLGSRAAARIRDAVRVEIGRVASLGGEKYRPTTEARPVPRELLPRLRSLLLGHKSYAYEGIGVKACPFAPGVALRFFPPKRAAPVEVLLCFECGDLGVIDGSQKIRLQAMDRIELALLSLVSSALPHDEELRALVPKKAREREEELAATIIEGDIIFQTSKSAQSAAIERATGSKYTHMGVIFLRDGRLQVLEASDTVRYTPLTEWIDRGKDRLYVVKRLKDAWSTLGDPTLARMRATARAFEGKPYDLTFEWSDARVYCSELVWKIYKNAVGIEIGSLQRLRDFRLDDPLVQRKFRERYGTHIPLTEPVVSPASIFASPLLETITQP